MFKLILAYLAAAVVFGIVTVLLRYSGVELGGIPTAIIAFVCLLFPVSLTKKMAKK